MKSRSSLSLLATEALADAPVDVEPPTDGETEDAVAAIEHALRGAQVRRRRRVAIGSALGVAAVAASVLLLVRRGDDQVARARAADVTGGVVLVRGERGAALDEGALVGEGDRVLASASGSARLALATGTRLDVEPGADLRVAAQGEVQRFELLAGSVHAKVAKLRAGERFLVATADAEVEVRGTEFRVEIADQVCQGTATRVVVTEGVVAVRAAGSEARVGVGERWPAGCGLAASAAPPARDDAHASPVATAGPALAGDEAPAPPRTTPAPAAAAPPAAGTSPRLPAPTVAATATAPPPTAPAPAATATAPVEPVASDLSAQNALFAQALAAKRRGDTSAAVGALDRLIARHPGGPLAESAHVERMRILAGVDRARAAEAARAYLARYPRGHARAEAARVLEAR